MGAMLKAILQHCIVNPTTIIFNALAVFNYFANIFMKLTNIVYVH